VAVSIFVNPLQFGPEEDFDRYPRTFEQDLEQCRHYGVDLIFAPDIQSMYPPGFQTHVDVGELTERLEGTHRPGHFRGVTTVVAKLFHAIGPCRAVFGRKDYQQWKVLERMALDLDMPVQVMARPTVREPDGLALSSRNRYLSAEQRRRALGLVQGLRAACRAWHDGERNAETLLRLARDPVESQFDRIDYVDIADPETLRPLEGSVPGRALIAAAAHLGSTRLIDNAVLGEDAP
jgi:pantoate--beta-alanine ligase